MQVVDTQFYAGTAKATLGVSTDLMGAGDEPVVHVTRAMFNAWEAGSMVIT